MARVKQYPSKPLVINLDLVRENPAGLPHGDVHLVLNIKWARKRTVTLCGLTTEDLRTLGSPFNGWAEVLCDACAEIIAQ